MYNKKTINKMFNGDIYALAKVISTVESSSPQTGEIMQDVFKTCKGTNTIGITGPPGAGKSSVIYHLVKNLSLNNKVAVLAIDPNSHITGGALLGDRIRMDDLEDVYIRSIGNRCATGGISTAAYYIIKILEACNYDYIFIETVGAGQSEVKIKDLADITVLILAPGLGDDIQANKAGIMEIGDVLVVNKSDKSDALRLEIELKDMLNTSQLQDANTPVFATDCINSKGFDKLSDYLISMLAKRADKKNDIGKLKVQCIDLMENKISKLIKQQFVSNKDTDEVMNKILLGELNISDVIDENIEKLFIKNN